VEWGKRHESHFCPIVYCVGVGEETCFVPSNWLYLLTVRSHLFPTKSQKEYNLKLFENGAEEGCFL
jgi:hypothetical protein